jgi:hypothetical protein
MNLLRNAAFRRQQVALKSGAPCRLKAAFRFRAALRERVLRGIITPALSPSDGERLYEPPRPAICSPEPPIGKSLEFSTTAGRFLDRVALRPGDGNPFVHFAIHFAHYKLDGFAGFFPGKDAFGDPFQFIETFTEARTDSLGIQLQFAAQIVVTQISEIP